MGTVGSRFEISTERVLHRRTERVAGDHHAVFVLHPENGRAGDVGGSVDRGGDGQRWTEGKVGCTDFESRQTRT